MLYWLDFVGSKLVFVSVSSSEWIFVSPFGRQNSPNNKTIRVIDSGRQVADGSCTSKAFVCCYWGSACAGDGLAGWLAVLTAPPV